MLTDFGGIWTTSTRRFAAMALINDVVGFSLPVAEKSRHLYIRASSKCISLSILIHPHPSFPSCRPIHPILSIPPLAIIFLRISHIIPIWKNPHPSPQEFPAKCWTQLSGSLMKSWSKHPQASAWLRRPPQSWQWKLYDLRQWCNDLREKIYRKHQETTVCVFFPSHLGGPVIFPETIPMEKQINIYIYWDSDTYIQITRTSSWSFRKIDHWTWLQYFPEHRAADRCSQKNLPLSGCCGCSSKDEIWIDMADMTHEYTHESWIIMNHDFQVFFKYSGRLHRFWPSSKLAGAKWLHTDLSISLFNNDGTKCRKRSEHRKFIYTGWWFQPLWKYVSQLGWLFPIYGKIKPCSKPPTSTNLFAMSVPEATATPPRPVPETCFVASQVTLLPRLDRKLPIYSIYSMIHPLKTWFV